MSPGPKNPSPSFQVFLGIDQTGAWDPRKRRPKPLPLVMIAKDPKDPSRFRLSTHALSALTPDALRSIGVDPLITPTLILVDSVFWPAPSESISNPPIMDTGLMWQEFCRARLHASRMEKLGSASAEDFFKTHHRPSGTLREVDRQVRAHSLYSPRPFQRNIQCGTYRVWVDLGTETEPWARMWPWPSKKTVPTWIAEGYPSWIKRSLKQNWNTNRVRWETWARTRIANSRDFEDAARLAFQAFETIHASDGPASSDLEPPSGFPVQEGWIFGVPSIRSSAAVTPEK
jgi:hypothetical protein